MNSEIHKSKRIKVIHDYSTTSSSDSKRKFEDEDENRISKYVKSDADTIPDMKLLSWPDDEKVMIIVYAVCYDRERYRHGLGGLLFSS